MYHPDRRPGDEEAARIMRVINNSYIALCDPVRKRDHDRWINEGLGTDAPSAESKTRQERAPIVEVPRTPRSRVQKHWMLLVTAGIFVSVILFGIFFGGLPDKSTPVNIIEPGAQRQPPGIGEAPPGIQQVVPVEPVPSVPRYTRPSSAPNDQPWPTLSDYLAGYEELNTDGLATVTIDNIQNQSDVYAKLCDPGVEKEGDARACDPPYAVRRIFVRARDKFVLKKVRAGMYDIRYQDLDSGVFRRSRPFELIEVEEPNGVRYSNYSLTLYTVLNGNTRSRIISKEEFGQ
jgi:hypothetical protein